MILEVSSEWRCAIGTQPTAEWSGLRRRYPQPEGIAMDNEILVYCESETSNLFINLRVICVAEMTKILFLLSQYAKTTEQVCY
ncbi:SdiA-regulated domain-containing protein [Salmonella enterica subsp. enterica]|nr:SdiA-regulated domain-containing protein [Salmonella enterica subsp. enterica]